MQSSVGCLWATWGDLWVRHSQQLMDRIEFLLELIPFNSPLERYLPLSQSLLSPPLNSLCDFYPSHVAPTHYSGCMREINLFGSILHSWRTLLLIHTFSFLCRRNHKQEKISWPLPVPSWRRGDKSKVKCSSDPLHASKLIFFFLASLACWNFSGNLDFHKEPLIHE